MNFVFADYLNDMHSEKTTSRVLLVWSIIGVPAALFVFVVLANATVPPGHPPLQGWRWPFYWVLFGALLISGAISVAKAIPPIFAAPDDCNELRSIYGGDSVRWWGPRINYVR